MLMRRVRIVGIPLSCISVALSVPSLSRTVGREHAGSQARRPAVGAPPLVTVADGEADIRSRINNWSSNILGGYNTGGLIRMADRR